MRSARGVFAACALLATACGRAAPPSPLAPVLGKQPSVPLGVCTLHDRSNGVTAIVCDGETWLNTIPIFGFTIAFFWIAWVYLKKPSGYRRDLRGMGLGLASLVAAAALTHVSYRLLEDHTFSVDRPRQLVTHEVSVFGTPTRTSQGIPAQSACTTRYAASNKRRMAGWEIKLGNGVETPREIGRLRTEADARAVCAYLLPRARSASD